MERREQFLKIVSPVSVNDNTALKFAQHLEELFDVIVPEKIGEDFCAAIKNDDYAAAVKACAKYYREKPDFTLPELSGKGSYSIQEAENCIREYMSSCCEIAEAADKKYLGEQLPEAFAKVKVSCSAAVQIASDSAGILNCKEKQKEGAQLGWYCYDSRVALPVYGADGELERYNVLAVSMLVRLDEDGKKYLYHLQRR